MSLVFHVLNASSGRYADKPMNYLATPPAFCRIKIKSGLMLQQWRRVN